MGLCKQAKNNQLFTPRLTSSRVWGMAQATETSESLIRRLCTFWPLVTQLIKLKVAIVFIHCIVC